MIQLTPMSQDEYESFIQRSEDEHARERMKTDFVSFDEALAVTRKMRQSLLPAGQLSAHHSFFKAIESSDSTLVGHIWIHLRPEAKEAFLYYIEIVPELRRKGYGRKTMTAIEAFSREQGARTMWLNVFGHNQSARSLYLAAGFQEAAIHMSKLL